MGDRDPAHARYEDIVDAICAWHEDARAAKVFGMPCVKRSGRVVFGFSLTGMVFKDHAVPPEVRGGVSEAPRRTTSLSHTNAAPRARLRPADAGLRLAPTGRGGGFCRKNAHTSPSGGTDVPGRERGMTHGVIPSA